MHPGARTHAHGAPKNTAQGGREINLYISAQCLVSRMPPNSFWGNYWLTGVFRVGMLCLLRHPGRREGTGFGQFGRGVDRNDHFIRIIPPVYLRFPWKSFLSFQVQRTLPMLFFLVTKKCSTLIINRFIVVVSIFSTMLADLSSIRGAEIVFFFV